MIEWIVALLVLVGTAMSLISSLGLLRLPDVYNRAHASTKSATLGILSILLGGFIYFLFTHGVSSIRLLLGIVFVFFTAPLAGHLIIRSAHRYGSPLAPISVQDDLKKLHSKEAMEEEMVRPVEAES
ncbi:monovalent cation/H(+) antiporter subunit G [Paenibacillus camelliae]|nr:monovalent cation/H(+) antiporter subunit G [Paenibacillus camelliae]